MHIPSVYALVFCAIKHRYILATISLYFVPTHTNFGKPSVKSTPTVAFCPQNLLIQRKMRNFAAEFVLHMSKKTIV